jgi:hypothetical protein
MLCTTLRKKQEGRGICFVFLLTGVFRVDPGGPDPDRGALGRGWALRG